MGSGALDAEEGVRVELRRGALVLLIGASGSGKTTFAHRWFGAGEILSSDTFRLLVSGDEDDQSATADAFRLLHLAAEARLRRGRLTVVDATNVLYASRRRLVQAAARHRRPAMAVVFALPEEVCQEWNRRRPGRSIGPQVVRRQHILMRRSLAHLPEEGFASISVLRTPAEIDSVVVMRPRVDRRS
jgi:protein phosphatase